MSYIIYLGWGSLLWEPSNLKIKSPWIISPIKLPLEFSRISDKGSGRLTLVIDKKNGTMNNIYFAIADTNNVNEAIKSLKIREKTKSKNIGFININNKKYRINDNISSNLYNDIFNWGKSIKAKAIIWTNLNSNWKKIRDKNYSVEDAFDYLKNSTENSRKDILKYISKAYNNDINTKFTKYILK
tara:strand:- start:349 stop:903 length:555 start_codon:yes stop_codon:yes gene_type:complete